VPLSLNHVVDLTSWGHLGGFNQVTLVLMVDLTMCPFKVFQRIKVCFKNDMINLLYAIQPEAPPANYHVDSSFTTTTKYLSFASTSLY
jgi:hypothetical protein